ncbi:unnamed protein product [Caenorhabditis sp. 36 PRJEB53466]|nr:unnamed protein product [Caenorhabditis sp. 36 PRJEB53466]
MTSFPTTLAEYYNTTYSKCAQMFGLIDSPEFLSIGSKSLALVIIPINLFGFLCILCRTPKYMKGFKWHLMHLHFWFLMLTTCYTLLATTYAFYPAQVRCSVGFLSHLRISSEYQFILITFVYIGLSTSIIMLFENRHKHLVPPTDIFYRIHDTHRIVLGVLNFCLGSTTYLPTLVTTVLATDRQQRQEQLKLAYLAVVPCPTALFFDPCSVAYDTSRTIWSIMANVCSGITSTQLLFFIVHSVWYLRKFRKMDNFSERTKHMQKAFFVASLVQVTAPICVIAGPLMMLTYIMTTGRYQQGLINVCILAIPAHSLFSTAALLYFIAPYRKFVKRLLRIEEESNTRMNMVSSVNL